MRICSANSLFYHSPAPTCNTPQAAPKKSRINSAKGTAQQTDAFEQSGALTCQSEEITVKMPGEMTMEEYKSYIREKLSQIPCHPSRNGDYAVVNISEKGFEAMKNDPEYEQWVLDKMKQEFAVNNIFLNTAGNIDGVYSFGASKEEYHGFSWLRGKDNGADKKTHNEKSKDSFWEKRLERRKENMQRSAELAYMRHMTEQLTLGMTDSPHGTPGSGSIFQAMLP